MGIKQRRGHERRQNKARIIFAAQRVFVPKGYETTTRARCRRQWARRRQLHDEAPVAMGTGASPEQNPR